MGTDTHGSQKAPDDTKPASSPAAMPPPPPTSCPPETPPLMDPVSFRNSRLTPNLREMIHSWDPALQDSNGPSHDIFASPDPTAMYNSMALPSPSPLLRDFYQGHTPMMGMPPTYLSAENADSRARAEKLSVVCEEMNGLFANLPQADGDRSDNNLDGVASNISSPDHEQLVKEARTKHESVPEQMQMSTSTMAPTTVKSHHHTSQSSYETGLLVDTSSLSPSSSPQLTETRVMRKPSTKSRKSDSRTPNNMGKKSGSKSEKGKRSPTRPKPIVKSQPRLTDHIPPNAAASAMTAANAFAMNSAMAGLIPFPGAIPAGIPQMYPGAGAMIYQGRPMAFVAGARGPELIPVDMLAQASALQYGAAQALHAAGRMNNAMAAHAASAQTGSPYESAGGSRKKRRRQMLERSGCSEEQARENRARALKRLRQKKTVRSQHGTVRYACRKRIAMVRPRVNGRFATKEEVEQSQQDTFLDN